MCSETFPFGPKMWTPSTQCNYASRAGISLCSIYEDNRASTATFSVLLDQVRATISSDPNGSIRSARPPKFMFVEKVIWKWNYQVSTGSWGW